MTVTLERQIDRNPYGLKKGAVRRTEERCDKDWYREMIASEDPLSHALLGLWGSLRRLHQAAGPDEVWDRPEAVVDQYRYFIGLLDRVDAMSALVVMAIREDAIRDRVAFPTAVLNELKPWQGPWRDTLRMPDLMSDRTITLRRQTEIRTECVTDWMRGLAERKRLFTDPDIVDEIMTSYQPIVAALEMLRVQIVEMMLLSEHQKWDLRHWQRPFSPDRRLVQYCAFLDLKNRVWETVTLLAAAVLLVLDRDASDG